MTDTVSIFSHIISLQAVSFCIAISLLTQFFKRYILANIPYLKTRPHIRKAILPLFPYISALVLWPIAPISLTILEVIFYGFLSEHIFRIAKTVLKKELKAHGNNDNS